MAWGYNDHGQCNVPALPPGLVYVEISAGFEHSLARRSDGSLVAWGSNPNGECDIPAAPAGFVYAEIAAGYNRTVVRLEPGCPEPSVYCDAKLNSQGCTPAISVVGLPSASAGSGCTLSTAHLLGGMFGLYLHSTAGAQALPFHGGVLCIQSPLWRHPAVNSGGSAAFCSGTLTEDFNAYMASGVDPALVAGATVHLQAWSRDTGDVFGDSLSDALVATICP
jgi:hypothetical protein